MKQFCALIHSNEYSLCCMPHLFLCKAVDRLYTEYCSAGPHVNSSVTRYCSLDEVQRDLRIRTVCHRRHIPTHTANTLTARHDYRHDYISSPKQQNTRNRYICLIGRSPHSKRMRLSTKHPLIQPHQPGLTKHQIEILQRLRRPKALHAILEIKLALLAPRAHAPP